MGFVFGITIAVLVGLSATLYTVYRLRPETFKVDATLTRWASFKIEISKPQGSKSRPPRHD